MNDAVIAKLVRKIGYEGVKVSTTCAELAAQCTRIFDLVDQLAAEIAAQKEKDNEGNATGTSGFGETS